MEDRVTAAATSDSLQVEARRVDSSLQRDLKIVEKLSDALDTKFSIAGVRFGWDFLIGFIPGVGDLATAVLALYPIFLARRHGLGWLIVLRMLGNVGLDFLIGLVPILGDMFDLAFKANRRNLELFREAVER